ncbi:ParB/RepB/Spo0J family partition protein [Parathalassolituus penaei]|uniref:Probable chromosome-partitioning protein ParB n=1 Tax=Parathalassolituus penaei TaxID=2997323 RepID=A0A9X3EEB4_9GAMM|nr:ParB/RepB/Spo0J family partition protein [Parathalassolituus penaei]MCY0965239.1 ParB/RepB/Spo0J family partition protein [Parathalassolituus penaei]
MNTKRKRGLGRGLDALLAASQAAMAEGEEFDSERSDEPAALGATPAAERDLTRLPLDHIQPGQYQPRRDIQPEALEELAESIRVQGLMQPIVVRLLAGSEDRYEIIAGERRWRASRLAGLDPIPVLIRNVADEAAIAMALIENIQREDLNPMEEAIALHRLQTEFELTQQEVAAAVGKNRTTVANLLRLMNLNGDVKRLLENGDIEMGHARALLGLDGQAQSDAAVQVVAKGMTVRQTEALVRQHEQKQDETKPVKTPVDPDIQRLERVLGDRLGAKVAIQHGSGGKGKLVINYSSLDELDGILGHIQ